MLYKSSIFLLVLIAFTQIANMLGLMYIVSRNPDC
jgi:hypothetical protein